MTIDSFWQGFLAHANLPATTTYYDSFHFCNSKELANELLKLVLSGQKTATTSILIAYEIEGEPMPQVGNYSIVTDWDGTPHCVIQTTAITIMPFNEMTYVICKREGEDECLETWVESHRRAFEYEGQELGFQFTKDMPILFEDFKVVYKR